MFDMSKAHGTIGWSGFDPYRVDVCANSATRAGDMDRSQLGGKNLVIFQTFDWMKITWLFGSSTKPSTDLECHCCEKTSCATLVPSCETARVDSVTRCWKLNSLTTRASSGFEACAMLILHLHAWMTPFSKVLINWETWPPLYLACSECQKIIIPTYVRCQLSHYFW